MCINYIICILIYVYYINILILIYVYYIIIYIVYHISYIIYYISYVICYMLYIIVFYARMYIISCHDIVTALRLGRSAESSRASTPKCPVWSIVDPGDEAPR